MRKVVIFGNSASGKSTLAKQLCESEKLAHLDLDRHAWTIASPPERKPLSESRQEIEQFTALNPSWVIEGCYSDLIEMVLPKSSEIIFLDISVKDCIANAKNRPWEPHKYESKEAQDANLEMLIDWIARYSERNDTFSSASHEQLFNNYSGKKTRYTNIERNR